MEKNTKMVPFFYKERKDRKILLKITDAQPCINSHTEPKGEEVKVKMFNIPYFKQKTVKKNKKMFFSFTFFR